MQVVDELFLETLKEDYTGYGDKMPLKMIEHLQTKISKVKNNNKVQLKDKLFIKQEQPQVLSAYFKQIDKVQMQLAKWKVKVSEDDIVIHVVDQICESHWFSEETMTKREEKNDGENMAQVSKIL